MEVQTLQTQREEQVRELQAKVEAVQSSSQEEVAELVGSLRALEGRRGQDASRLQGELNEAQKSAELSNALVEDMQTQIDTLNHDKAELEVLSFHLSCRCTSQTGRCTSQTGRVPGLQYLSLQHNAQQLLFAGLYQAQGHACTCSYLQPVVPLRECSHLLEPSCVEHHSSAF